MFRHVSGTETENRARTTLEDAPASSRDGDAGVPWSLALMAKLCLLVSLLVPLAVQLFSRHD